MTLIRTVGGSPLSGLIMARLIEVGLGEAALVGSPPDLKTLDTIQIGRMDERDVLPRFAQQGKQKAQWKQERSGRQRP